MEWCGGWKVTQQDEACQRANELIMSQRLACSWCCKASCFISSHLAYVPGKGLKLSGRESEAHDTVQLSYMLIQFMCTSLGYHNHSSLKLCRKGSVKRPQGGFTATGSCGQNTLGSFATRLKEWWSSASPLNVWAFRFRNSSAFLHDLRKGLEKMLQTNAASAYHGRRGSYLCSRNIKMKAKFALRTIGTWNGRTLMDSTKAYRPETDSSSCKRNWQT